MSLKIIHVVTAHRTTKSQHSYVVGVYETVHEAEHAAAIETINRGGKYKMKTDIFYLNRQPDDLTNTEHDNGT
jgi:hypothetical protein